MTKAIHPVRYTHAYIQIEASRTSSSHVCDL